MYIFLRLRFRGAWWVEQRNRIDDTNDGNIDRHPLTGDNTHGIAARNVVDRFANTCVV